MRTLFWLPAILADIYELTLPRRLFVAIYKPASPTRAEAENILRNAERLAAFKAKRALWK